MRERLRFQGSSIIMGATRVRAEIRLSYFFEGSQQIKLYGNLAVSLAPHVASQEHRRGA